MKLTLQISDWHPEGEVGEIYVEECPELARVLRVYFEKEHGEDEASTALLDEVVDYLKTLEPSLN